MLSVLIPCHIRNNMSALRTIETEAALHWGS